MALDVESRVRTAAAGPLRLAADEGDSEVAPRAAGNLGLLLEEQGDVEGAIRAVIAQGLNVVASASHAATLPPLSRHPSRTRWIHR